MKSIDMKRLGQTMLWSIRNEKKHYVRIIITFFVVFFFIIGAHSGMFTGYQSPVSEFSIQSAATLCTITWIITGACMTAELFSNLRTKQQRAAYLMLPATNAEKYISRVVLALGQGLLLTTAALIVADAVSMLITFIFAGNAVSTVAMIAKDITIHCPDSLMEGICITAVVLWSVSGYILGGTIFRKVPVVLTTLVWNLLWIILFIAFGGLAVAIYHKLPPMEVEFWWGAEFTFELVLTIIATAFIVFNMWYSYRLFKRQSLISGKWMNI